MTALTSSRGMSARSDATGGARFGRAAYPVYDNRGRYWFGNVPEHWTAKRLKYVASFLSGGTPPRDRLEYWSGDLPWVSPKDMKAEFIDDSEERISETAVSDGGTRAVPAGAVLLVVRSGILRHTIPVAVALRRVAVNQDLKALLLCDEMRPQYLAALIRGLVEPLLLEWRKSGTTVESIEHDQLANTVVPLPPLDEQDSITAFLGEELGQLDPLIAKKERQIELLQEKRAAVISQAVTRGLDPSVPMKPSGVEWLGEIPEHWEVRRLMHLTPDARPIMYGIVLPGPSVADGVPIIKGGNVAPGGLSLHRLSRTTREIDMAHARSRVAGGDLVFAIRGSIGAVERVPGELGGANLTQDAARVSPRSDVCAQWLLCALRAQQTFAQLDAGAAGATIRGINIRDLKRVRLPVPPPDEQREISAYLDVEIGSIERLVSKIRQHIATLREYRSALITAAVTGQIDVRGVAR